MKKWLSFGFTTGREGEYKRALNEGLRRQYLGQVEEEVKPKRHREQFMMQWHNEDDTSDKLDPLYRNIGKAHLAFGKGYVAGVDMRKQRKDSQYMESLLSLREQAVRTRSFIHSKAKEHRDVVMNTDTEALNQQLLRTILRKQQEKEETVFSLSSSHVVVVQVDVAGPRHALVGEGACRHDGARLAHHARGLRDPRAGRAVGESAAILVGGGAGPVDSAGDRGAGVQGAVADPATVDSAGAEGLRRDRHREDGKWKDVCVRGADAAVREMRRRQS